MELTIVGKVWMDRYFFAIEFDKQKELKVKSVDFVDRSDVSNVFRAGLMKRF
jgi:hypothetical protein